MSYASYIIHKPAVKIAFYIIKMKVGKSDNLVSCTNKFNGNRIGTFFR